jgi:AraC family transcriptional regulator
VLSLKNSPPLGEHNVFFPERTIPLRAMLGSVGRTKTSNASYHWNGRRRGSAEFSLFQYTLKGRGQLRAGNREYSVTPGTAMLLHFPDDNQYWLPANSPEWDFLYICVHGREISRLWRNIEHTLGPLASLPPAHMTVQCASKIVHSALANKITDAFTASALAYELIMLLSVEAQQRRTHSQARAALDHVCLYAEQNLATPRTVAELARQAGMSRYHFTRLFTVHTGLPPAAWLAEQRIKEAARLLRLTTVPIKEIAARCGFPNANYLSRVFRKHTGIPPAAYRRSGA